MCLPYFTSAIYFYKPVISVICVIGCIYGSLLSLSQNDMKKLIAYSSVSHMSLCSLGLFSGNFFGIIGSFVMAIGHSFISSGLFYLVGVIYDRYHSRSIDYFSGLSAYMPNLSFFFFLFIISNF
jgi:NADH-ubiquinone oxidoreductase chain 4